MAVAICTKTLIINPAFLQEIKDCNPDLWTLVHRLGRIDSMVDRRGDEPSQTLGELTRLLDELRDQLALQFSLEESYGYIELPEQVAAHTSRVTSALAQQTQSQHTSLYLKLSDLSEQTQELQYRGVEPRRLRELLAWSGDFYSELQEHERMEQELIRRSCDVG